MKIHSSCSEIEDFVETHLCKLCDTPIARITGDYINLWGAYVALRLLLIVYFEVLNRGNGYDTHVFLGGLC